MIRKLNETDRTPLVSLLSAAPEYNLYTLGNVEVLGFDEDFCEFFGDFDEQGRLRGCANRYMVGWAIYGLPAADFGGLAALIDNDPHAARLQDNPGGVSSVIPFLRRTIVKREETQWLMRLAAQDFRPQPVAPGLHVRRATLVDLPRLIEHFTDAEYMSRTPAGTERPLRDGTVYVAETAEGGEPRIVSSALTNAESSTMAMVGGVYTLPDWRGRGLSQAVVGTLCAELLGRGLTPVLYWVEADAGHVYRKLGFRPAGDWRSVWLEPQVGAG